MSKVRQFFSSLFKKKQEDPPPPTTSKDTAKPTTTTTSAASTGPRANKCADSNNNVTVRMTTSTRQVAPALKAKNGPKTTQQSQYCSPDKTPRSSYQQPKSTAAVAVDQNKAARSGVKAVDKNRATRSEEARAVERSKAARSQSRSVAVRSQYQKTSAEQTTSNKRSEMGRAPTTGSRERSREKEQNSRSSLSSRLRNASERMARRVKTFVSRPIKEETMNKVVARVQARKPNTTTAPVDGADMFPTRRKQGADQVFAAEVPEVTPTSMSADAQVAPDVGSLLPVSGCRTVKNNDNDGKLFVGGKPFWSGKRKPTKEDIEPAPASESKSDDDLPLNGEVILDVHEGKVKLVNMPTIPIVLDSYHELSDLTRRDRLFFNKNLLFGNTIRSMINLSDASDCSLRLVPTRSRPSTDIKITEPRDMKTYTRDNYKKTTNCAFTPGEREDKGKSTEDTKKE